MGVNQDDHALVSEISPNWVTTTATTKNSARRHVWLVLRSNARSIEGASSAATRE